MLHYLQSCIWFLLIGGLSASTATAGEVTYNHPIRGQVYLDENGNGEFDDGEKPRAGVAVSDMFDVVLTDEGGFYELANARGEANFVFVHQPGDIVQSGQEFFHRLPADSDGSERFDFGLEPATPTKGVTFVQLSDSHVRNPSDREYMIEATSEIYAMSPAPDFVVATGDLVDWGIDEHFQNYVAGMQAPPIPYFNVFGNHEVARSPGIHLYHQYIGPDYFSFERGGVLFLALNCFIKSERQDLWLRRTLERLGQERSVVIMQHFPPTLEEIERFADMGVVSIFSGHWHSEKEMEHAGVQSINSPSFIMGGIDASPAGFKMVHMAPDGSVETGWRYGFQKEQLTIVSPQEGTPVSSSEFPILVNAYDTTKDVVSATWRLGTEDDPVGSGKLTRESAISWRGEHNDSQFRRGNYPLRIEIVDTIGGVWTKEQQVDASVGPPAAPVPGSDWPMFMGNPAHTGLSKESIDHLPLRLAWSVDTGGDPDFASPILAGGRIYLGLKKRTKGRTNGVAAFDPVTGERLWVTETGMSINHTPAFSEGILCVGELGGRIYGLEASTGREIWRHDLIDARGRYMYGAPAIHDGWFYAGVMRRIARLNPADGRLGWERTIGPDRDWLGGYGSPAVGGEVLVMASHFGGENIVARRIDDNTKLWAHGGISALLGSPTIAGDRVLFCSQSSILFCVGLNDGTPLWERKLVEKGGGKSWSATTPAVRMSGAGKGIVVAGSGNGNMHGLDLATGEILWTHVSGDTVFKVSPYRRDRRPLLSSPTIAGNKVFFGSADGHLYCLDLETGKELWAFPIGISVLSTPLVSGNAVYVAAYDGRLYAFTSSGEGEP